MVPGASGDTPGPDRGHSGEGGDETQFAHHGVENHRRGLVVEVAPNVVDATAVELPSSPHASVVDALEFDFSVPAFDPMQSDEEDEFDAGVPTVPGPDRDRSRARDFHEEETARPTQLDGDDEPLVSAPSWVTRNRFAALQSFDHADEASPLGMCGREAMEFDLTRQDSETDGAPPPDNEVLPAVPLSTPVPAILRRPVLVQGEGAGARRVGDVSGSDTDSVVATDDEAMDPSMASDDEEDNELLVVEPVAPVLPSVAAQRAGLNQLDHWDLDEIFARRASVMKTVPRFLWGSFRIALRVALAEIVNGAVRRNELQQEREDGSFSFFCPG